MTSGANTGANKFEANDIDTDVEAVSLDSFWSKRKKPKVGLLKIDVEGGEEKVLNGALELIDSEKPVIFYEALDGGKMDHALHDFVRGLNYEIQRVGAEDYMGTFKG